MEEKIINDINKSTGMSFFYPCSGMDIESVINILNYKYDFLMARTFFLVDLNIDHDDDVTGWNQRQLYFDNKLGINNLKITKTFFQYQKKRGYNEINSQKNVRNRYFWLSLLINDIYSF